MRILPVLAAFAALSFSPTAHAGVLRALADMARGPGLVCGPDAVYVGAGYGPTGYNSYPHCEYVQRPYVERPSVYPGGYQSPYEGGAYQQGRVVGYAERAGQEAGHAVACAAFGCQAVLPQAYYYGGSYYIHQPVSQQNEVQVRCPAGIVGLCYQYPNGQLDVRH